MHTPEVDGKIHSEITNNFLLTGLGQLGNFKKQLTIDLLKMAFIVIVIAFWASSGLSTNIFQLVKFVELWIASKHVLKC